MHADRLLPFLPALLLTALAAVTASEPTSGHWLSSAILIGGLALYRSHATEQARLADWMLGLLSSALLLIPSVQLGWVLVLLIVLWLWPGSMASHRRALLIMAAAALHPLVNTYVLKLLAGPVLSLDAALAAALLGALGNESGHQGNLILGPAGHSVLVLRGCSSMANVSTALLIWFAVARWQALRTGWREAVVAMALVAALFALNVVRLVSMSLNLDWHAWWHAADGLLAYQTGLFAVLLLIVPLGLRWLPRQRLAAARTARPATLSGGHLAVLILGGTIAGSGLFARLQAHPAGMTPAAAPELAQLAGLQQRLAAHGFEGGRAVHYTRDRGIRGLQIPLTDCRGNLQITVMPEGDELLDLWMSLAEQSGYSVIFAFDNDLFDDFPLFTFWHRTLSHALAQHLRVGVSDSPGPVWAIAHPPQCEAVHRLPWAQITTGVQAYEDSNPARRSDHHERDPLLGIRL